MNTIEYQPHLFDSFAVDMLRREFEKQRKSFFVRYNLLEKRVKELEERNEFLERSICRTETKS
jgi:hypothetical protein